jgi:diguanylate cyclase (GGDEF)-like protein/PAS domain S-box-containing protein
LVKKGRFAADVTPVAEEITGRLAGRLAALLYLLCAPLTALGAFALPAAPGASRGAVIAVGIVAALTGAVIWVVPWDRWHDSATLWLLPPTFALIGAYGAFSGHDGYRYGIFLFVSFAWIGVSHPLGTSSKFAPLAAAAYLAPLAITGQWTAISVSSIAFALPSWVLVGETIAWLSGRLRRAQRSLSERELSVRRLFTENPQPMWVYDAWSKQFLEVNAAAIAHYGYAREQFLAMSVPAVLAVTPTTVVPSGVAAAGNGSERTTATRHVLADGRVIDVEITEHRLTFDGVDAVLVAVQDVTGRNELEDQLRHQAFHDALTGLANRALFADRVGHAVARRRTDGSRVAVVLIDLNGFKTVNDSLGHSCGDQLLVGVAERLRAGLRAGDTAARLGGDEFAILLEDIAATEHVGARIQRLMLAFDAPFDVAGMSIVATASAGVAFNEPGDGPEELLRNADTAMYRAKSQGLTRVEVFERSMHDAALERLEMEAELRRAVDLGEFVLHYQPTISMRTGQVLGFEALLRWEHPRRGTVAPLEFVPVAEETGLINAIGRWVLGEACRQGREWQQLRPDLGLTIAVNLSAAQFGDPRLVDDVAVMLAASEFEASHLVLEITESAVMENTQRAVACLNRMKTMGVRLAIDDFGTGYSSLGYLRTLPVDIVKIDKSFVERVGLEPEARGVIEAVVHLARTLQLETVAEGVETPDQAHHLAQLGCDQVQGFHYSHPLPADDVATFLAGPARPFAPEETRRAG